MRARVRIFFNLYLSIMSQQHDPPTAACAKRCSLLKNSYQGKKETRQRKIFSFNFLKNTLHTLTYIVIYYMKGDATI